MTRGKKKRFAYHIIAAATLAGILVLGFLRCSQAFLRFWESVRDLFHSLGYFTLLFPVTPTVAGISYGMEEGAPRVWAEVVEVAKLFGSRFISAENFFSYLSLLAGGLTKFIYFFLAFVILVGVPFGLCLYKSIKTQNRDHNQKTKALQRFLRFEEHVLSPCKRFVTGFWKFYRRHKLYSVSALLIALYFMNAYTLALEALAWLFYFVLSFDLPNLGVQAIKLCYDVGLGFRLFPWWVWCIVGFYIFDKIRREIGYRRLEKREDQLRDFIDERPIVSMICAPMREGKTTLLASLLMSLEKKMRDDAKDGMRDIDMKFPRFPWIVLEKMIQKEMKRHRVFTLETTREWVAGIFAMYKALKEDPRTLKLYRRRLRKEYGLTFSNAFFGYDTAHLPMEYNGGLGKESIYTAITTYAQLYFIYVSPTSMIVSNFPVRLDDDYDDIGNFPRWYDDFFRRDPSPLEKSRMSHVLVQDAMRLGKVMDPNNPYKDSLEYGAIGFTEVGKERGNQKDMEGISKTDENVNQKNDLFNSQLKLIGHSATVYFIPFIRFLCDEQRPESWGADARELCDIITLTEKSSDKILLPFFAVEEALYLVTKKVFGKLYDEQRYNRGDHTLPMYLFKAIYKKIYDHFQRVRNTFGGYTVKAHVTAGNGEGKMSKSKLFVSRKKVYTDRFDTAAYRGFYAGKAKRSRYGLNDTPVYKGLTPTEEELHLQASHFFEKLFVIFGEQKAKEIVAQLAATINEAYKNKPTKGRKPSTTAKTTQNAEGQEGGKAEACESEKDDTTAA